MKINLWAMGLGIASLCTFSAIFRYAVEKRSETEIRKAEIKAGAANKPKVEIIDEEKK